jgi:CHAT domain-containing protein
MGDPTTGLEELPWARDEAWTVAALFKTEPLLGDGATESRLHREAKRVGDLDLLHLAAHGVYRPEEPRHSRIALAEGNGHDGSLSVEEVYDAVDLRGVNLVVLSACQTALGEHTEGDEIIGLTRAFLDAGSPTVVSSLWRVDDEATGFLMKVFYERLLAGASYAEALRAAQLETSAQADWTEPYYWAAFALTGDPKGRWNVEGLSKDTNLEPRSGELR